MADITQTPADVLVDTDVTPTYVSGFSGEAINAGMPVYQTNANTGYWYKANAGGNALQAGSQAGICIALANAPGIGQPLQLLRGGKLNLGATLESGETYVVSATAGAIAPIGDLVTNNYTVILGVATNAARLRTPGSNTFATGVPRASNVT